MDHCKKEGVRYVICVASDYESGVKIAKISENFEMVLPCAGFHPVHFMKSKDSENELNDVCEFIRRYSNELYCIGEIGLDFSPWVVKCEDDKNKQIAAFKKQIALAKEFSLPIVCVINVIRILIFFRIFIREMLVITP